MLKIERITIPPFCQNVRIILDTTSKSAVVLDPGGEIQKILSRLSELDLTCEQVWLTHSHLDHCGGVAKLIAATSAKLFAHSSEKEMRLRVVDEAVSFGLSPDEFENCPEPDTYLEEGNTVAVGRFEFKVLHIPGHSPGHLAFWNAENKVVLSGDSLFKGCIAKVTLPGADAATLLRSIRQKLLTLPGDTAILCGHGPDTTIDFEIEHNPFLVAPALPS